ncbi:MAG: CAP domain-containing protein [Cyanobacteria bacterium J06626_18]
MRFTPVPKYNWRRASLCLLTVAIARAIPSIPSAVTPIQAQASHPFEGHVVVYALSGDRWREAVITGFSSSYSSDQPQTVWTYSIQYVDDQGGKETSVTPSRLLTIEDAQAQGLTETVYDLTTQAGIDQMLAAHNQARREVGVPDLVWSEPLAELAQDWADTLISESSGLRHRAAAERDNGRIGENLSSSYWSLAGGALRSPQRAIQGWIEEKADYDYASNTCAVGKVCGHYTQVVWADTTEVGCAVARNEDLTRDVWVCNYAPMGNIVGQRPY